MTNDDVVMSIELRGDLFLYNLAQVVGCWPPVPVAVVVTLMVVLGPAVVVELELEVEVEE